MPPSHNSLASLRKRLSPVCVAVTAGECAELFRIAEAELEENSFVELRLDSLERPHEAVPALSALCRSFPDSILLATCRRQAGGGGFRGSAEEQLALLLGFAQSGASLVDLELETLEAVSQERLHRFGQELALAGAVLVASAHDFHRTSNPAAMLARLQKVGEAAGAAVYKVVSTAGGLADNLAILRFMEAASQEVPLVAMCMGKAGLPSRVLGLRAGAAWTFASASVGEATAAGQVSARVLREQYGIPRIGPGTRVYGVAGNPVAHSLSPAMHNAAFRAKDVDAVYLPLHTTSLDDLLKLVRELPVAGLSVTMPWKVGLLPKLDVVDPLTTAIGAVNTVVRREDGTLWGANTDAAAIAEPLAKRIALAGARVLLLGAGGAARAAAFALLAAGAEVAILNRTRATAEQLARESGARVAERSRVRGFDVILNATPSGMAGGALADALPVDEDALEGAQVVVETVYRPRETPLVRAARARGIEVIDGLEMFLHQGARQWSLWTGQAAPLAAMRAALGEQDPGEKERHGEVR